MTQFYLRAETSDMFPLLHQMSLCWQFKDHHLQQGVQFKTNSDVWQA